MGKFQRAVGLVIFGSAAATAALLWFAVAANGGTASGPPREGVVFGIWRPL